MSVKPKTSLYQIMKTSLQASRSGGGVLALAMLVSDGINHVVIAGQKGQCWSSIVGRRSSIDGLGCGVVAGRAVIELLSGAESNGSNELRI